MVVLVIWPRGLLVFQGGYHPRKTKHVNRVVFSRPGNVRKYIVIWGKNIQKWEKGYVFGDGHKF